MCLLLHLYDFSIEKRQSPGKKVKRKLLYFGCSGRPPFTLLKLPMGECTEILVKLPMGGCRAPPRVTPGKGDVGEFPAMAIRRGRLGYLCGLSDGMLMLRRGQKLHKRNSLHKLIYKRKALWQRQSTILS